MFSPSQSDLAAAAGLSLGTVRSFEPGKRMPIANNLMALQRALEAAGVEFMNGDQPGVRLRTSAWASEGGNTLEAGPSLVCLAMWISPHKLRAILSPTQIRAARMMLGWTQVELCQRVRLSEPALVEIERGTSEPKASTLATIQRTLEAAGIEFTNGGQPGVQMRRKPE
jgi:transcriptional regulator with XRE-family HTH domain